jgi:tRNA pseudouridine55 synthase
MLHGLLNVNKPGGLTSRQVVDRVVRLVRPAKAGHAGTLDPLATGVLVVAVGDATRLIQYLHQRPKAYTATYLLGRQSPTEDVEGQVVELPNPPVPTLQELQAAAGRMTGPLMQRPPQFSAIHVAGRRAYELARRGDEVTLQPRPITVHRMAIVEYQYPVLKVDVECSSGTYVRSLGRDLAESLGTAAVMSELVRTRVADFQLPRAQNLDALTRDNLAQHLEPPLVAVTWMPQVSLSYEEAADVRNGRPVRRAPAVGESGECAAVDAEGHLLAILVPRGPGLLGPECVLRA